MLFRSERVFIMATYDPERIGPPDPDPVARPREFYGQDDNFEWNIYEFLFGRNVDGYDLSPAEIRWVDAWDDWVQRYKKHRPNDKLPGFPIWVDSWQTTESLEAQIDSGELDDVPPWKIKFM